MPILSTKGLAKEFDGVKALNNLSLSFEEGKITSIVGPNGSGKTTLINVLTGTIPFNDGIVVIREIELSRVKPHSVKVYGVTRTFQTIRLFEQMSVLDNILVVLTERNIFSALFEKHTDFHVEQAKDVLTKVDLWEKKNEKAENLSYGQRKLLEIARALAMKADIYLFDEPFAGLFPSMVEMVISIVRELKEQGKTVVLIEHNMDIIRKLSDYVIVLDTGMLLAEGKPEEVLSRKDVIEAYLGE
jgi:branched-chain amino acid transport system ATP-binding protein